MGDGCLIQGQIVAERNESQSNWLTASCSAAGRGIICALSRGHNRNVLDQLHLRDRQL